MPHELYERLADHSGLLSHVIDGHETLHHISGHVEGAIGHAEAAGAASHFPVVGPAIVIGLAVGLNCLEYRRGNVTLDQSLRRIGERGALAVVASASGWAAVALAHEPVIGLPISIAVRLAGGQYLHNRRRKELLQGYIDTVVDSRTHLKTLLQRPLLEGATT